MTLSDQLDLLLTTPPWRLRRDLEPWLGATPWYAEALADPRGRPFRALRDATQAYFRDGIAEHWPIIQRRLRQEIARRSRDLGTHGLDYVLNSIHPRLWWRPPFLSADLTADDLPAQIDLNGRGIVFVPSLWWSSTFSAKINPWDPLVITYPVRARSCPSPVPSTDRDRLTQLIGRTRAAVLIQVDHRPGQTTSQIGADCAISVSSASEHAKALRDSGLISAVRDRNTVRHQVTELGARLIRGG
jgi:DNA-binding transcriptional ArsR family regulator